MPRKFDWDPFKAEKNVRKHGIELGWAMGVFGDKRRIEDIDDREDYGEERIKVVGMVVGAMIAVIYTERRGDYRLISAREATRR